MELTEKRPQQVNFSTYVGFQLDLNQACSVNKYWVVFGMLETLTKFQDSVLI